MSALATDSSVSIASDPEEWKKFWIPDWRKGDQR
jgi:hypothetical protein